MVYFSNISSLDSPNIYSRLTATVTLLTVSKDNTEISITLFIIYIAQIIPTCGKIQGVEILSPHWPPESWILSPKYHICGPQGGEGEILSRSGSSRHDMDLGYYQENPSKSMLLRSDHTGKMALKT